MRLQSTLRKSLLKSWGSPPRGGRPRATASCRCDEWAVRVGEAALPSVAVLGRESLWGHRGLGYLAGLKVGTGWTPASLGASVASCGIGFVTYKQVEVVILGLAGPHQLTTEPEPPGLPVERETRTRHSPQTNGPPSDATNERLGHTHGRCRCERARAIATVSPLGSC
jgi:hypothetical protein